MQEFWNERYNQAEYVYGVEPNTFFAESIQSLNPGTIILPCEGEGRNAVHAAINGWKVLAFDSSEIGKIKAMQLAIQKSVQIDYIINEADLVDYPENIADLVAFVYAHFPQETRKKIHQKAIKWLKPGGKIVLEAFNPNQLTLDSGGPKNPTMLYTIEMLQSDFKNLDINLLETTNIHLSEGKFHTGKAAIIRLIGTKKIENSVVL